MSHRLTLAAPGLILALLALTACSDATPAAPGGTGGVTPPLPTPNGPGEVTPLPTPSPTPTMTPSPTPTPLPMVRVEKAETALANGDWAGAVEEFQAALNQSGEADLRAAALLGLGQARLRAGDAEAAIADLEQFVGQFAASPEAATAHFWLAEAYRAQAAWEQAIAEYQQYLSLRPGRIDGYVYERLGLAAQALGDAERARGAYLAAIGAPRTGEVNSLRARLAQLYVNEGDYAAAIEQYDAVIANTGQSWLAGQMHFLAGQALLAMQREDEAHARFLTGVNQFPDAPDSYQALIALVEAGAPVDEFQRGLTDYYAQAYTPAIAAFQRYLQSHPDHDSRAHYYLALAYRDSGSLGAALATFDDLIATHPADSLWAQAWMEKARSQWLWDDDLAGAAATYRAFVEAAPADPLAPEALWQAGRMLEQRGDLETAAEVWGQLASEYPQSVRAGEAAFKAGIARYRLGQPAQAAALFEQARSLARDATANAAALMWLGRIRRELGDAPASNNAYASAIEADQPYGYYSLRATDLATAQTRIFPQAGEYDFAFDEQTERAAAEAWLAETLGIPDPGDLGDLAPSVAADPRWQRGRELWRLGLRLEARAELEALRSAFSGDALASYQLALAFRELGLYRSSILAARSALRAAGVTDAFAVPRYFTLLRYPAYYADLVIPAAQAYHLDPLLLFALIRQESLFEGFATSGAAARGLMQVIPPTGDWIASRLGWRDYQESDLYRPVVSIQFGAYYLAQQMEYFDGDAFAALAAYNAGPGNAEIWLNLAPNDPDLFLEVIRLDQPHQYIRHIYEIYAVYRDLYAVKE